MERGGLDHLGHCNPHQPALPNAVGWALSPRRLSKAASEAFFNTLFSSATGVHASTQGLAAGRRRDRVPETDLAIGQDIGPQSALVDQTGDHAWPGQSLQVHAWLTEALPKRTHGPDRELLSNQGVEVDAPGDDIAPGLGRREV